jgi:hypothetical protein
MPGPIGESLDRALESASTRRIPQSAQAQMKCLVKQLKGIRPPLRRSGSPSAPWRGTSRASCSGPDRTCGAA